MKPEESPTSASWTALIISAVVAGAAYVLIRYDQSKNASTTPDTTPLQAGNAVQVPAQAVGGAFGGSVAVVVTSVASTTFTGDVFAVVDDQGNYSSLPMLLPNQGRSVTVPLSSIQKRLPTP